MIAFDGERQLQSNSHSSTLHDQLLVMNRVVKEELRPVCADSGVRRMLQNEVQKESLK